MTRKVKILIMMTVVLFVAVFAASIGVTAAYWATQGGSESTGEIGTGMQSEDWNAWAKYFQFENYNSDGSQVAITGFYYQPEDGGEGYGFNHGRLVIPREITVDGAPKTVKAIRGEIFKDTVLKEMVEELYIHNDVEFIGASAFSSLVNLKTVVLEKGDAELKLDMFAFANCPNLSKSSVTGGGRTIKYAASATEEIVFLGCAA